VREAGSVFIAITNLKTVKRFYFVLPVALRELYSSEQSLQFEDPGLACDHVLHFCSRRAASEQHAYGTKLLVQRLPGLEDGGAERD
jgi:hypothetical protein